MSQLSIEELKARGRVYSFRSDLKSLWGQVDGLKSRALSYKEALPENYALSRAPGELHSIQTKLERLAAAIIQEM